MDSPVWIWLPSAQSGLPNVYARFRTFFPAGADRLRVSASGNFVARLDGAEIGFGQYTDFPWKKTYTEIVSLPSVRDRVLEVDVWFSGNRFSSHYDGEPGLWAVCFCGESVCNVSSEEWEVAPLDCYSFGPRNILFVSHNYTWEYDARRTAFRFQKAAKLLKPVMNTPVLRPVEPVAVTRTLDGRLIANGKDFAVFDFGEEVAGRLSFSLSAVQAGTRVEILHGEYLKNGRLQDFDGGSADSEARKMVDVYLTSQGCQSYSHALRRYGLRYVEFRWEGSEISDITVQLRETALPGMETPPFSCSDKLFESIHEINCRTLRTCLHEKYENCPWREQSICEYDARNQMLFGYPIWGNYNRAAAMIRLFGDAEKEHGFLPAITPSASGTTIPMFTFAWILSVCEHFRYSGDDAVLREMTPKIVRMFDKIMSWRKGDLYTVPESLPNAWIWNYCEPNNLEYCGNPPNAFYNLYLREALLAFADAQKREGEIERADRYEAEAMRLGEACEVYWDEARGLYGDTVDGSGKKENFFGHIQALFLAQGLIPPARVPRVISALREGRVILPELSALMYLVKGVFDYGTDADRIWMHGKIREIYGGMIAAGATTWWEASNGPDYAGGGGSLCHGWSAMPAWYIAEYILGVRPTSPGYATYEVRPRVPGISASGTVMTPRGPLAVQCNHQLRNSATSA